jgi:hypothetical protein
VHKPHKAEPADWPETGLLDRLNDRLNALPSWAVWTIIGIESIAAYVVLILVAGGPA